MKFVNNLTVHSSICSSEGQGIQWVCFDVPNNENSTGCYDIRCDVFPDPFSIIDCNECLHFRGEESINNTIVTTYCEAFQCGNAYNVIGYNFQIIVEDKGNTIKQSK